MNLADYTSITIPEGNVTAIAINGITVWSRYEEPIYKNLLPKAQEIDSANPFNGTGYMTGVYLTDVSPFYKSSKANEWVTGCIPYTIDKPIYIKGVSFTTASHDRMYFFTDKGTRIPPGITGSRSTLSTHFNIEQLGADHWKLTPISGSGLSDETRWVRMSFTTGSPASVIIAVGGVTNLVLYSTEADGNTIYNGGLGYKDGYRVRSGGAEVELASASCTGYIPYKKGDIAYIYPKFTGLNTNNAINFYDSAFNCLGQVTDSGSGYGFCAGYASIFKTTVVNGVSVLDISSITVSGIDSVAYIRVTNNIASIESGAEMIVTINEEIPL